MARTAIGELNLAMLAERAFERRGDYPSLLFEGRWYGSGELFERSRRIAAGLSALGVSPGERVVVTMANCPEVGTIYNALWRAGAVVTPVTFRLPAEELRQVIADAEACAVVTTPEFALKVSEAVAGVDSIRFLISSDDIGGDFIALESLEESEPGPIVGRSDDDLAALLYTGGTTGRAKGVMLAHSNLHISGRSAHRAAHVPG
jgi:long-chain acyl-CoA synthetase